MHSTQQGYCFGVLLIFISTTITLPPAGWCEPTAHPSQPLFHHPAPHHDRSSVLTTRGFTHRPSTHRPSTREGRTLLRLGSWRGGASEDLQHGAGTNSSGARPEQRLKPRMVSSSGDAGFRSRYKWRRPEGEWVYSSHSPPNGNCSNGKIKHVVFGSFYITGQLEPNIPHLGYLSDSAVAARAQRGQARVRGQQVSSSEESWQKLQPVVECGDDAMTLTVRRRRAVQLLLDRANESSVPLSQLPPECGYSIHTTWRDLSLMAQYDACHVIQEDERYVLPLLWRGTPVKMSCPVSQTKPQAVGPTSLCCSPYGMTVKVRGMSATEEQKINVRGEWTPLVLLAEQCGYTLDKQGAEIVIAAPFITCGITIKDGKYTLSLKIGKRIFTLACPVSYPKELMVTHQPLLNSPPHLTRGATKSMLASLEPFPWAPPFYLAPPYYPHPTYYLNSASPDVHDSYNPPTPPSLTPEPTFSSQPLPPVDPQPDYQDFYSHQVAQREPYERFSIHSSPSSRGEMEDSSPVYPSTKQRQETSVTGLSQRHRATPTGFPAQVEAPHFQPPSHDFNLYYHYYHHPKIPLRGTPQDPDPGPVLSEELSTIPPNHDLPVLPRYVQQSEGLSKVTPDQFPAPETTSHPYTLPTNSRFAHKAPAPHAPYPLQPYPHRYFYYFPHVARGEARKLSLLHLDKAAKTNLSHAHSLPHSPVPPVHNERSSTNEPNTDKSLNVGKSSREWIKHPFLSDDVKSEPEDKNRLFTTTTPAVQPPVPQTSPHGPDPVAGPLPKQPPLSTPTFNYNPFQHYYHPYYDYYRMYYGPDGMLGADFDYTRMAWSVHGDEAGYPSIPLPLHNPFNTLHSYYITPQHPYDPFLQPGGEAEKNLDTGMRDPLKANAYTPSASPCGLGPVSDFDCSNAFGCCSYIVKDCTVGQYYAFAVPDSVVDPALAPRVYSFDGSNVSCTLQRLTSDLDIYIEPQDDCVVNAHMYGTDVHLLEVQRVHSYQGSNSAHENSPFRLVVGCSSSPGDVRFLMNRPPLPPVQPSPATLTVQLRIATDESFTSFHPEAHLPLSLIQGRPVYVEVSLLDPPEPNLMLLVHSCLAYTQAPYASWMLVHDGCPRQGVSQLLPSSDPYHIHKINISSFVSLPSEGSPYTKGGYSFLEDPEIYFLCLTEVCSAADGDCTVNCLRAF